MYATERQQYITDVLAEHGRVSVVELAGRFDVTTETVRRDLAVLESTGDLRRVHGGAVPRDRASTREPSLAERRVHQGSAKSAIGRRALDVLGHDFRGSLYFDAGTTTAAVADELLRSDREPHVNIVTHSLTLAHALAIGDSGARSSSLSVIGGRIRGLTAAAVGADTVRTIEGLRPDVAFVGANGVTAEFGLSTPDPDESAVKSAIVRAARRVVAVIDSDKFGRDLLVSFAELADIDVVVTDREPEEGLSAALRDAGVDVWIA
jgi:DeoR family transcriptional regulator, fructose operon transcriptional repressor